MSDMVAIQVPGSDAPKLLGFLDGADVLVVAIHRQTGVVLSEQFDVGALTARTDHFDIIDAVANKLREEGTLPPDTMDAFRGLPDD